MLVYGDRVRDASLAEVVDELRARLDGLDAPGPPIERHGRLVAVFILAGELAQALIDHAHARDGGDGPSGEEEAAFALLTPLAEAVVASWRALGEGLAAPALDGRRVAQALAALQALPAPPTLKLKTGEGYAYYALYPEGYAAAAERLALTPDTAVVGLRSIGTGLAAVVAAACGSDAPVTLRPVGHPFQREIALTAAGAARLAAKAGGAAVIVDEGPGLSGSSFGAAADALEALGFAPAAIAMLPGHGGDLGPNASPAHRARWATARRSVVDVDALILSRDAGPRHVAAWFADLTGGEPHAVGDISGGAWRALTLAEADWPAANTFQERRKLLLDGSNGRWLLKFAGLGRIGEAVFAAERRLAQAGLSPQPHALRHGFIARPWLEATGPALTVEDRPAFLRHLGGYLGWRAAQLAAPEAGASLEALCEMAHVNALAALGPAAQGASALDPVRWRDAPSPRPVWTDNRLHAQEWLRVGPHAWLKTDAADHALAHDLVGPQDIAWDVAGAIVEFGLGPAERARLVAAVQDASPVEPPLVALMEPAYAAFQFAAYRMAADAHGGWPQELARLERAAGRYRRALAHSLSA